MTITNRSDRPRSSWPDPLPECSMCARPTVRAVFEANAGTCSDCAGLVDYLAPDPDRVDLAQWQQLVARRGRAERERQRRRAERRRRRA